MTFLPAEMGSLFCPGLVGSACLSLLRSIVHVSPVSQSHRVPSLSSSQQQDPTAASSLGGRGRNGTAKTDTHQVTL